MGFWPCLCGLIELARPYNAIKTCNALQYRLCPNSKYISHACPTLFLTIGLPHCFHLTLQYFQLYIWPRISTCVLSETPLLSCSITLFFQHMQGTDDTVPIDLLAAKHVARTRPSRAFPREPRRTRRGCRWAGTRGGAQWASAPTRTPIPRAALAWPCQGSWRGGRHPGATPPSFSRYRRPRGFGTC